MPHKLEFPPFTGHDALCPKCSAVLRTEYHSFGHGEYSSYICCDHAPGWPKGVEASAFDYWDLENPENNDMSEEHLHRICECGYHRVEALHPPGEARKAVYKTVISLESIQKYADEGWEVVAASPTPGGMDWFALMVR